MRRYDNRPIRLAIAVVLMWTAGWLIASAVALLLRAT